MSIVKEFEAAFNRQDVKALVALFTPSGTYRDNFFGDHAGSASLREMFRRMFHEGRDYTWTMEAVRRDSPSAPPPSGRSATSPREPCRGAPGERCASGA